MAKPSEKEDGITALLREEIISGALAPDMKLPTYGELTERFSASQMTIHKVIRRLKNEGFVQGQERKGVFVSPRPPHLNRVAVILSCPARFNRFSACLEYSARDFERETGREVSLYTNLNGTFFLPEDAARLRAELASRALAGIFCGFKPEDCPDTTLFDAPIPRIFTSIEEKHIGSRMLLDPEAFARRALASMRDSGVRKLAMLSYPIANYAMQAAQRLLGEYGMASRPEWQIAMQNADIAEQICRLLMSGEGSRRPDGLILFDDHLVEYAARGLVAEGVRVPEELKVLSHCNLLMPPSCPFPIRLLGFDSGDIIRRAVRAIDEGNRGKMPERLVTTPVFLDERA